MKQKIKDINISDLHLWTENPRDPISVNDNYNDLDVIRRAIDKNPKKWNLNKLIKEMGDYYDTSELPTVVKKDRKYIVYDGNRRVSIIKYLQNPHWSTHLENLLFPTQTSLLKEIKTLPCNVCDKDTALNNIERKHINSGSWKQLERDYFQHIHRSKEKTLFIKFEEATGLISANPKLNERIFKENILTKNNLNQIGFDFDDNGRFVSNYDKEIAVKILDKFAELRNNQTISSRDGKYKKYQVKEPIKDSLDNDIVPFKSKESHDVDYLIGSLSGGGQSSNTTNNDSKIRKTKRNNISNEILFGEKLALKEGDINNLYSILDDLFDKYRSDENILPIIGISLRLLMEMAGRKAYPEDFKGKDKVFGEFMKKVKEEKILEKYETNTVALDKNFKLNCENFEAYIGKYAHGMIKYDKTNILNFSKIVGIILKHYFPKQ